MHTRRKTLLDLFCGCGGWSAAAPRSWRRIGYDVTNRGYPGKLILKALPVDLDELRSHRPSLLLASPPCEEFARRCLPWLNLDRPAELKSAIHQLEWSVSLVGQFDCPVIVECSRFAARYVRGARFVGSYALWGDVPALLPEIPRNKERLSGLDPARRAMIEPELSSWIFATSGAV